MNGLIEQKQRNENQTATVIQVVFKKNKNKKKEPATPSVCDTTPRLQAHFSIIITKASIIQIIYYTYVFLPLQTNYAVVSHRHLFQQVICHQVILTSKRPSCLFFFFLWRCEKKKILKQ